MSSQAWPRSAAPHCSLPLGSGFAGCRHAARRQFCSEGRRHLINTSYARPAGPINRGLGRAAPGLPGRPYIPAFIFFFFGDYGHQSRKNLTGGTRLIKNPPRLAVRSPWRAFLLIICSPRKEGEHCKRKYGEARPVAAFLVMDAAPGLARLKCPRPFMIQHIYPP